jgi:hypothetical protein
MKAAAVEAATAMKAAAVKATSTAEATAVETATMKAAIKAAMKAAIKETITVPEAKVAVKTKPGATDEDAPVKPCRAVIAVGGAAIRVIAIGADGSWTVIDRPSKAKSKSEALGVRAASREQRDTEKNAE